MEKTTETDGLPETHDTATTTGADISIDETIERYLRGELNSAGCTCSHHHHHGDGDHQCQCGR